LSSEVLQTAKGFTTSGNESFIAVMFGTVDRQTVFSERHAATLSIKLKYSIA
jgi:hypothetical protein